MPSPLPLAQLAQGVVCGTWPLAFHFDWARQIVNQFELTPIPRAPLWLLGATNVGGIILPVLDLASFFAPPQPGQATRPAATQALVGGLYAEDTQAAMALVFTGLPVQLDTLGPPLDSAIPPAPLPERLRDVCLGSTHQGQEQIFWDIDPQRLTQAIAAELSVL